MFSSPGWPGSHDLLASASLSPGIIDSVPLPESEASLGYRVEFKKDLPVADCTHINKCLLVFTKQATGTGSMCITYSLEHTQPTEQEASVCSYYCTGKWQDG